MQQRSKISRAEVLSYVSPTLEAPENSILHDAIVSDDVELARVVIMQDSSALDGQTIINKKSLGNTALLLALKTGLITVAEALLAHPQIDIHVPDERGLSALHWACTLRQDRIITLLLDAGADPQLVTTSWTASALDEKEDITPLNLYKREISAHYLGHYIDLAQLAVKYSYFPQDFLRQYPSYGRCFFYSDGSQLLHRSGFTDRQDLHIPGEMACTDIVFHMDALCRHLGWQGKETVFITPEEVTRSSSMFAQNFHRGYGDFCRCRNARQPDAVLLERMAVNSPSPAKGAAKGVTKGSSIHFTL